MKIFGGTILFCLFFVSLSWADLIVWQPKSYSHSFLIYKESSESYQKAAERYLSIKMQVPELAEFVQELHLSSEDQFKELDAATKTLLLANKVSDQTSTGRRILEFTSRFSDQFMKTTVLPVGATEVLNSSQKNKFLDEISHHFDLLVALGGDDVHPELYGEKITWARHLNLARDRAEIDVLRHYHHNSPGKILGVCRGLQITSVMLGYKLNQDVFQDLKTQIPHADGILHPVEVLPTTQNTLIKMLGVQRSLQVNSYHHQSLRLQSLQLNPYLEIAALAPDGVVEAAESQDGRVLLFQFHPEMQDLYPKTGKMIFQSVKAWGKPQSKKAVRLSCRNVTAR